MMEVGEAPLTICQAAALLVLVLEAAVVEAAVVEADQLSTRVWVAAELWLIAM